MKFRASVLNISAVIFLIGVIVYLVLNYEQLSANEGWGVVSMIGLLGVGIALLILDVIIQLVFKNKRAANIIGAIIAITTTILLLFK
jgi:hypothetical protein